MAGKRLKDNDSITLSKNKFKEGDAFIVCNEIDRKIGITEFLKALAQGTGLEGGFTFATSEQLNKLFGGASGNNYRIKDGKLEFYNSGDSQWYTINITKSSKVLSWDDKEAVSVNSNGVIQHPSNFITANKLVTADGGQLKSMSAGTGIIGDDFNGKEDKTWKLDWSAVENKINTIVTTAKSELMATIKAQSYITADNGEHVEIKARIIEVDGIKVPQFYPVIKEETEE